MTSVTLFLSPQDLRTNYDPDSATTLPYHMVTLKRLHDRGFLEELDAFSWAGQLIHCLQGHGRGRPFGLQALCQPLVHHAKGTLAQFSDYGDLLPGHLPLIRDIH